MSRVVAVGVLLVVGVVVAGWGIWGAGVLAATSASSLLGLLVHLVAASRLRRVLEGEPKGLGGANLKDVAGAFALGMGMRLLGIALVVVAVLWERTRFPAAPSLLAYGAVVVPLLFMEMRFLK